MNRRVTILIGILISLLLLWLTFAGVDLDRVWLALAEADYRYLVPALLLLSLGLLTRGYRWRVLLSDRVPISHAISILNISYLLNGALPFRLGELARLFLLTRLPESIPVFTTLSSILVERLLDMLTVVGMLGLVLVVLPVPGTVTSAGIGLGVAAVVGLVGLIVLANYPGWAFRLLAQLERLLPILRRWSLATMLTRFVEGLTPLTSWRSVLLSVFWTVISWALSVIAGYVLMYIFFPSPTWIATMLFIALAALAVAIPYAPGAVGPYEAGVVLALTLTGFDQPEGAAIAFAIVLHVMNVGVYTILGIIGLVHQGVSLGQVMRGSQEVKAAPAATAESPD